jgi:hypothetical protein
MIPNGGSQIKVMSVRYANYHIFSALMPEQAPQRSEKTMPRLKGADITLLSGEGGITSTLRVPVIYERASNK